MLLFNKEKCICSDLCRLFVRKTLSKVSLFVFRNKCFWFLGNMLRILSFKRNKNKEGL